MTKNEMIATIDEIFGFYEKPASARILSMSPDEFEYKEILDDICSLTENDLHGDVIRFIGRCFPVLSKETARWVMPFYLKACLEGDSEFGRLETNRLILALSPSELFVEKRKELFSLLNKQQLLFLLEFLNWLEGCEYWLDSWGDELNDAKIFVKLMGTSESPLFSENSDSK
jgi:hypothetical protein